MSTIRITEIFCSLQGESNTVGWPTVFVRLTGCPLRCKYCDTAYAFSGGEKQNISDILKQVSDYDVKHVTVTGGEPLAQPAVKELLSKLCEWDFNVSLETSGAIDLAGVDNRVMVVMDIKTPNSGEEHRNMYSNLEHLKASDQVKFVISDQLDYDWSKAKVLEHDLANRFEVLFSPCSGTMPARALADWIVKDKLPVRFQIQLHKYLWGDQPGV